MRSSIFIGLMAAFIQTAAAQDAAPPSVPNDGQAAEAGKLLKRQFIQKQLEAAGLKDVRISPEVNVVHAKDKDDKQVVLVVDPETMVAIPLNIPGEPSTTGSGSEDEGDEKL